MIYYLHWARVSRETPASFVHSCPSYNSAILSALLPMVLIILLQNEGDRGKLFLQYFANPQMIANLTAGAYPP